MPDWKITKAGDCRKVILEGKAEGLTEVIMEAQEGYEIKETTEMTD